MGAAMNLRVIAEVGASGILYTVLGISGTLLMSWAFGRLLKTNSEISALLGAGTAICGGSAIAAVAPVIRAKDESISLSLATVFILNAVALALFPFLGHWSMLDQRQFGLFSALAIHDTSSVVGAAMTYGPEALTVATIVKLVRTLWIVPVAAGFAVLWRSGSKTSSFRKPWFILGFLAMAALVTWVPSLSEPGQWLASASRKVLVLTLFLIGAGLSRHTIKSVGPRPMFHGLLLWMVVTLGTLSAIRMGWIQ
jgi:uncharacterized integral membrane protein (TIGR00698 family)